MLHGECDYANRAVAASWSADKRQYTISAERQLLVAQVKSPKFLPHKDKPLVSEESPSIEQLEFSPSDSPPPQLGLLKFAMLLPMEAAGLSGHAARDFRRGCIQSVQVDGGLVEVDIYAGSGDAEEMIRNYEAAAQSGAQAVIAGLLKSQARALTERYPESLLPTLLLQQGSGSYYVMTLDDLREAADLARQLHRREDIQNLLIVEQDNARGRRQRQAFESTLNSFGVSITAAMLMRDIEHDWQRLFERMKEAEPTPIFVAGTPQFAINVRNFSPLRHPVFAISAVNNGGGTDALILNNLAFMEMPWFLGLPEQLAAYDSAAARALSFVRQRFFAFGADACRAILQQPNWRNGWEFLGVSGHWQLQGAVFSRHDSVSVYQGGRLLPLAE